MLAILDHTCKLWQTANIDLSALNSTVKTNLAQRTAMKDQNVSVWSGRAETLAAKITTAVRSYADKVREKEAIRREKEKKEIAELKEQQDVIEVEAKDRKEEFSRKIQKPEKQKGNLMNELKTFELKIDAKAVKQWDKAVRQAWLSAVVDNMRSRFPHHKIVSVLDTLFNPENLPKAFSLDYGNDALETLIGHFGVERAGEKPVIDAPSTRAEWPHSSTHCWRPHSTRAKKPKKPKTPSNPNQPVATSLDSRLGWPACSK